ncbi:MAG: YihY/virulence factor BrkB family protein [Longimicrobiales bacterium]
MGPRHLGRLVVRTVERFSAQGGMRHGAALAFYATLSLAPLVLLAVSVLSLLPTTGDTWQMISDRLVLLVGDAGRDLVRSVVEQAPDRDGSVWGVVGSVALLAFGGSVLFVNIQAILDQIWNVRQPDRGVVKGFLKNRLTAFVMMGATALILLGSTFLGGVAAWLGPRVETVVPIGSGLVSVVELALSTVLLTGLCAATYRILPAAQIAWRDVMLGAVLTAVLFLLGRWAISWYLGRAAAASRYGAAGTLLVFLMWVYYSAQIFLLGAEFTQVQAEERGTPIRPEPGARRVEQVTVENPDHV